MDHTNANAHRGWLGLLHTKYHCRPSILLVEAVYDRFRHCERFRGPTRCSRLVPGTARHRDDTSERFRFSHGWTSLVGEKRKLEGMFSQWSPCHLAHTHTPTTVITLISPCLRSPSVPRFPESQFLTTCPGKKSQFSRDDQFVPFLAWRPGFVPTCPSLQPYA